MTKGALETSRVTRKETRGPFVPVGLTHALGQWVSPSHFHWLRFPAYLSASPFPPGRLLLTPPPAPLCPNPPGAFATPPVPPRSPETPGWPPSLRQSPPLRAKVYVQATEPAFCSQLPRSFLHCVLLRPSIECLPCSRHSLCASQGTEQTHYCPRETDERMGRTFLYIARFQT